MSVEIAPSILTADLTRLGKQIEATLQAGAERIHIDVMDGRFVPNLTFGPLVVSALSPLTKDAGALLEAHLMVEKPEDLIPDFVQAGAELIIVHVETCPHLHRTIQQIKDLGVRAGVTLNPATPIISIEPILNEVDQVLIMSVNPGFGGQSFISSSTRKIAGLRDMLNDQQLDNVDVEVDGGINQITAPEVVSAGANVLVVGSCIYNSEASVGENLASIRRSIQE